MIFFSLMVQYYIMLSLISLFTGSWNKIYALLVGVGIFVYSYLINRDAKLKINNDLLNKEVEDVKGDADKLITIQRKQAEIAAEPSSSRSDLYSRMRQISTDRIKSK